MSGRMRWERQSTARMEKQTNTRGDTLQINSGKKMYCPACSAPFTDDAKYREHWKEKHRGAHV